VSHSHPRFFFIWYWYGWYLVRVYAGVKSEEHPQVWAQGALLRDGPYETVILAVDWKPGVEMGGVQ